MKVTTPGNASVNGSGNRPEPKTRAAEIRTIERQKQWRNLQAGFRAIVSEMKRVTWPSREEWVSATMVVVGLVVIVALWTRFMSFIVETVFGLGKAS